MGGEEQLMVGILLHTPRRMQSSYMRMHSSTRDADRHAAPRDVDEMQMRCR
jgi:hypothetical protein